MNFSGKIGILTAAVVMVLLFISACATPSSLKHVNADPVIENVLYPKDAFANSEIQIQCVALDADGDNLTYKWMSESGKIKGEGAIVMWFPPDKLGTYPVSVIVADGKGGEVKQTIGIRVVTNADGSATPTIEIKLKLGETQPVVIEKQRARIWTTTEIVCLVDGSGAEQLTFTWTTNGGKIITKNQQEGKPDKIGWIAPGNAGDYTIEVLVSDSNMNQAKGLVKMQVYCCGN